MRKSQKMAGAIALAIIVLDQVTKLVIQKTMVLYTSHPVIPDFFNIVHVLNRGAAFGFLNAIDFPHKWLVVTIAAVVALVAIAVYAGRYAGGTLLARAGLAMVLAGAVGNLVDRARLGYVVDFVDAHYAGWHFWAFNVADSAITVGAAALILDIIRTPRHVPETA